MCWGKNCYFDKYPPDGKIARINTKKGQTLLVVYEEDQNYKRYVLNSELKNGTVLVNEPNIVIKTPNGALEITKLRTPIKLKVGSKLN